MDRLRSRPLLVAAAATALIAVDAAVPRSSATPRVSSLPPPTAPAAIPVSPPPCPSGTLPDHGLCVPVRQPEPTPDALALDLLPGRPEDPARYATPVADGVAAPLPGGSDWHVAARAGVYVHAIALESQVGDARRASIGEPQPQLLTLHRVERSGAQRLYVVSYSGVDVEASAAAAGATWTKVTTGTRIARISSAPPPIGLRFHVRQLRRGVDAERTAPERLLRDSHSVPCDPRNVLPLRPRAGD